MSFFNKPKRNLRVRGITEPEDGEDALETVRMSNEIRKPKVHKTKQSLLSFEEDLEGDDGEVFKVKKSAQSKKIKKQMDKERKKKKDKGSSPNTINDKSKSSLDQDIVIKLKNTFPILNGREAEKADLDAHSSDDDTPSSVPMHRFTKKSDLVIERGKIPDAATIHAARKQRQHVREMGEVVALPEEPESFENNKSRLVREDDNDVSDGEQERLNMAVNLAHEDKMRRKAEFEAAQHLDYEESDKGEEEEWEAQQIRKGVTGAQIAAVQQETMYYQQYMGSVGIPAVPIIPSSVDIGDVMDMAPMETASAVFPPLPSAGNNEPQLVIAKLKDRLAEVQLVHRRHCLDRDAAFDEVESIKKENDKMRENTPWLGERFRFYQDLRGYVTDLVDCLDEKILVIKLLEQRVEELYSQKINECIARRRQDVIDQTHELAPQKGRERDENEVRRIAEREGRRIRRQRARELKGLNNHVEGMSSDEETTETEQINIRAQREVIEQDVKHVFDDVLEEFCTIEGVLRKFENWKKFDLDAYTEAYVSLCLPKILGPLIRMQIVLWNPFSPGANEIEKHQWFYSLAQFCLDESESETKLRSDPDVQLLPRVIEKVIIPKLTQLVSKCWDPLSSSQTVSLVGLVTKFIQDYPTVNHSSKFLSALLKAVVDKMKEAVENDVYIPLYPRQRLAESKLNSFFLRQCAVATKLLSNIVRWQSIISDNLLAEIALDALLTRYLVMAMRNSPPLQAANLCQIIGNALPRIWLQVYVHPPQLTTFLNEAKNIARQLDIDKPMERDAFERMGSILKAMA